MALTRRIQIDRLSIADQVYEHLRSEILAGALRQGERVIEAQVAKNLHISRAPVREAVNRLLQDGLLETKTHFGPSVIQMTPEKIRSLYDLRAAIEGLAIREVVRRRNDLDLAPLRSCVVEMKRCARRKDLAGLVDVELEFHRLLCALAGNPYIIKVNAILDAQVRMALTIDNAQYENLTDAADEHEPILEAIQSGDAAKAARLIEAHILSSLSSFASAAAVPSKRVKASNPNKAV
jgi:DNA-binding GntR family transcriptional regulator